MHSHPTRALPAVFALSLLLVPLLAGPTAALGQAGRRPIQPIPPRPAVTTPGKPAIVTPGRPAIVSPGRPAVVTPAQPAVISRSIPIISQPLTPSQPITTYPLTKPTKPIPGHGHGHGHGHDHGPWDKPKPPFCPPNIIIIPSFPSAFIGPEIVSVTTHPTETEVADLPTPLMEQGQTQVGDPAGVQGDAATPRLIAILGRIERVDGALPSNASRTSGSTRTKDDPTGDGDQLCLAFGTLTSYYNPDPDQPTEAMARGTYLGSRWDGDAWHTSATGLWSRGPVTRQPIFTLHELQPSVHPFEVARPGHRITSLRMAIALVKDSSSSSFSNSSSTSPSSTPSQTQKRHLTMANSLRRHLQESNEPIPLAPPSSSSSSSSTPTFPSPDPSETYLGNAHSPFGQALAASLQELLSNPSLPQPSPSSGSVPQPPLNDRSATAQPSQTSGSVSASQPSTFNSQLLGLAEYTLPLSDLRDILSGCPRFTTIPLPADLQTVRSRDTSPAPLWVRPFRIEVGADNGSGSQPVTYQGEVWFLIVPNKAISL